MRRKILEVTEISNQEELEAFIVQQVGSDKVQAIIRSLVARVKYASPKSTLKTLRLNKLPGANTEV